MNNKLSATDRAKVEELIKIRERNNNYAWMLCDYLDQNPCLITKELMAESNPGGILPDEAIYTALLTGFCGLNPEENPDDRILLNDYFRRSVVKLNAKAYAEDPYYKNIRIPNVKFGRWELKYEHYKAYEAFVCDEMILDPDFKEIQRIGFFDCDFSYPAVMEDGHEWMAIKPNETATITFAVNAAHGKVATFGLGMGYYPYLVHLKPNVESITIIERSAEVIELFKTHILPQFDMPEKVRIVQSDAFEYAEKQMPAEKFDYAFADTWRDVSDGLSMYLRMKKLEHLNPHTEFSYWVEESLLSGYRWQMFDTIIDNAASYDEVCRCLSDEGLRKFAATRIKVEM
ncbi:MAG: hypothetical protein J6T98_00435 [Salinivirgaceae bacterium]|nr:hypothetical protein [Salinivirgaceae bacterium]